MENNKKKLLSVLILIAFAQLVQGQNNPGFLGKKIAIGYSMQLCPAQILHFDEPYFRRNITNHDFILEYATSKFRSITACMSYQKVPVYNVYSSRNEMSQTYNLDGKNFTAIYGLEKGSANFRALSFGFRYNYYSKNKTISSPIGYCRYIRFDVFKNKAISNYEYRLKNGSELTLKQQNLAKNPEIENSKSTNFSIGYGVESKIAISRSCFFRVNGEFNLSTAWLAPYPKSNGNSAPTISENLIYRGASMNRLRNMFLFGIGIGAIL